jgi:TRAP-type transport system periplasmic protein
MECALGVALSNVPSGANMMGPRLKATASSLMCATVLVVMTTFNLPASAAEKWAFYTYGSVATHPAVRGVNQMIEEIAKETKGALSFRLHLGGSLPISTTTITQAVSDGVVTIADDGFFLGNVPIAGVLRLPMLIRTTDEYSKAAAIMEPYVATAFARKGVVVLGEYLFPLQVPFSRKELRALKDIKGQKLRVSSPEQGEFVKRLGGVPVTLGTPEVAPALDRGVVDGVFTASAGGGILWKDLLKYNYRIGVNYFNSVIIVNKDAFERLAP